MPNTPRDPFQVEFVSNIPGSSDDESFSPILPTGQTVWVKEILMADQALGDGFSSLFQLHWGSGSDWETVIFAALTGSTLVFPIEREFVGDGVSKLRVIRDNKSSSSKAMGVIIKGIKR